jgi:hypothetical protein
VLRYKESVRKKGNNCDDEQEEEAMNYKDFWFEMILKIIKLITSKHFRLQGDSLRRFQKARLELIRQVNLENNNFCCFERENAIKMRLKCISMPKCD